MKINFFKMHGIGNDYIYVNCLKETIKEPEALSRYVSHRHFGVGSDGLVMILPSSTADFKMRIFNADGSEAMMCGNAIRCVGKYVYEQKLIDRQQVAVETNSGTKHLDLTVEGDYVTQVAVDMGQAELVPRKIPMNADGDTFVAQPIEAAGRQWVTTCVSMGNPHAIIFVDDVDGLELERIGPAFEHHPLFPNRVNTEFVRVIDDHTLQMRVWERGSGETFACGTGACAVGVAAVLCGHARRGERLLIHLTGGDLHVTWRADGTVLMEGPAAHVCDGVLNFPPLP